jgi:hypothetical protein
LHDPSARSKVTLSAVRAHWSPSATHTPTTSPKQTGNLGLHLFIATVGLLIVSFADSASRAGHSWGNSAFWVGLVLIVLPIGYRLLDADLARGDRLALVVLLGLALYAVKILMSPGAFDLHDELGQYRSVEDVLRSGRLLEPNPIVPAYSYYPALLSITAALSRLSGLGVFASGVIVVGMARCLLMVGLFGLIDRVTGSARVAGIAALLYATEPNFLFFNAEFAYESLGIALAILALWATARAADRRTAGVTDTLVALILVAAVVVTHHLTSYALVATLVAWALVQAVRRNGRTSRLVLVSLFAIAGALAWAAVAYKATKSDIGSSLSGSVAGLVGILSGSGAGKHPFSSARGYPDPPLEVLTGLASVALLALAWPFGLWAAWSARRRHAAIVVLALGALVYPVTLSLRLSAMGTETSNRSSEFVFVGLGMVIALAFARWVSPRIDGSRARSRIVRSLAVGFVGVVFLGGVTVGWPDYEVLPGPYEVAAEARSVDPLSVSAARWAGANLPPAARMLSDTMNQQLMEAYGGLDPQGGEAGSEPLSNLFLSPAFGPTQARIITYDKLRYLVVDRRLASALPRSGRYFDPGPEPHGYVRPVSLTALGKFATVHSLDLVFDDGPILIYDTGPLLRGSR